MQNENQFHTLLQQLQRPINCLADEDRNTRRTGLNTLRQRIKEISVQNALKLFNETRLTALLSRTIADKIEANRQISLEIFSNLITKAKDDGKNIYELVLPSLIQRVNQNPFPENSEDLRLKIITIFIQLMQYKECLLKNLPELSSGISKCLQDGYDQIKINCCELLNLLSKNLRKQIGKHSDSLVKSIGKNLGFNKFKVRKASLQTLGKILITEGAGPHFVNIEAGLKAALSDKKMEVRVAALECVSNLLHYLGPKYMRQYEATLIGFLMLGFIDESEQVRAKALELGEKCGKRLKQEEQEDTMKNEESEIQEQ